MADLAELGIRVRYIDDKASKKLKDVEGQAQRTKKATDQLGTGTKRASDQMTQSLGSFEGALDRVIQRVKMFASFMVAAFVLTEVQAAIRGMIQTISEFDQALYNLQAITRATRAEAEAMGDAIRDVARDTKFSAGEVSEGMRLIGQAGFSAAESVQAVEGVATLATGTMEDFGNVVDLVTTTIRAFNLETVETNRVADVFATAINESKLSIDKLRKAFNYVGAAGRQAGLTLEETSGALMVLANNGIRASTMGTGLRRMLLSLVAPNTELHSALRSVGLEVDEINPKIVGMETALKNLASILWDSEKATIDMGLAKEFFGVRAAQVAGILGEAVSSGGSYAEMVEKTKQIGAASRMAALQQEGLDLKFKNLQDRVKNVAIALGEAGLLDVLHGTVDALREGATAAESLFEAFPGATKLTGLAAGIGSVTAAVAALKIGVTALSGVFKVLWATMTGPIGKITAVFTAIIGAAQKYTSELENQADAHAKNAVEIRENIESIESWEKSLQSAMEESERAYKDRLRRFIEENENLSQSLVDIANDMGLFGSEGVKSIEGILHKTGDLEKFNDVMGDLFKEYRVRQTKEEIDEVTQSLSKMAEQADRTYDRPQSIPYDEARELSKKYSKELGRELKSHQELIQIHTEKQKAEKYSTEEAIQRQKTLARLIISLGEETGQTFDELQEKLSGITLLEEWPAKMRKSVNTLLKEMYDFGEDSGKQVEQGLEDRLDLFPKKIRKLAKDLRDEGKDVQLAEFWMKRDEIEDEAKEFKKTWESMGYDENKVDELVTNKKIDLYKKAYEEITGTAKDETDETKKQTDRQIDIYERFFDTVGNMNTDFVRELQDAVKGGEVGRVEDLIPLASSELKRKIEENNQKLEDSRKLLVLIGADGSTEFAKANEQIAKLERETAKLKKQFGELDEQEAMARFNKEADRFDDKVETIYNKHGEGTDKAQRKVNALVEEYRRLILVLGVSGSEVEEFIKKINEAAGPTGFERVLEVFDDFEKEVGSSWKQMADVTDSTLQHMEDALTDWIMEGKLKWKEFARAVIAEIVRIMIVRQTMAQATDWLGGMLGSEKGNVFSNGKHVKKYASGGIVDKPTVFPMANGAGLMGEKGPEAIMPLERTSSGDLGVKSSGEGAAPNLEVNVIDNTSEKKDVSKDEPKWNGEKWVMNVVLDAANRNKSGFRNGMKAALNK